MRVEFKIQRVSPHSAHPQCIVCGRRCAILEPWRHSTKHSHRNTERNRHDSQYVHRRGRVGMGVPLCMCVCFCLSAIVWNRTGAFCICKLRHVLCSLRRTNADTDAPLTRHISEPVCVCVWFRCVVFPVLAAPNLWHMRQLFCPLCVCIQSLQFPPLKRNSHNRSSGKFVYAADIAQMFWVSTDLRRRTLDLGAD